MDDTNGDSFIVDRPEIFSEKIKIISRSGKIFIITNNNQQLNKGDFITLSLKDRGPLARAIVAKNKDGSTGIKILKVYSLKRWKSITNGSIVDITKGDDSYLFKKKTPKKKREIEEKITSEEDLYNDKEIALDDEFGDFYKDTRLIKPDNIVSIGWNQFEFQNDIDPNLPQTEAHSQFNYGWAYQFSDNYWVEGLYGRVLIDGFPDEAEQTIINNFTIRAKYTFKAPFYSYFMPYVGFQVYQVSSPQAGIIDDNSSATSRQKAERETALINKLSQNNFVLGVTVLKRLVPGWFVKLDLGSDIFSAGVAIEF